MVGGNQGPWATTPWRQGIKQQSRQFMRSACVLSLILTAACLEKQPDSEITIGGSYGGVGGNKADLSQTRLGTVTGKGNGTEAKDDPSSEHAAVEHVDMPSGHGNPDDDTVQAKALTADAVADSAKSSPDTSIAHTEAAGAPEAVEHNDMEHVDRPPGFGQDEGQAAAKAGSPGGSLEGSIPNIASPFERNHEGQEMVVVSGKLLLEGGSKGIADIDCFQLDPESPAKRKFVNKIKAIAPGEFTMKVPKGYGPLILSAFLDISGDGPDPSDPQGQYVDNPLTVGDTDIADIDIILEAR